MKNKLLAILAAGLLSWPMIASPQVAISPGGERTVNTFQDGGVACRVGTEDRECLFSLGFNGTEVDISASKVSTHSRFAVTGIPGIPRYANATLFKTISIDGPPDTHVPVAVSVTFDYENNMLGAAGFSAGSTISLAIRDRETGKFVASQTLFESGLDGGIGVSVPPSGDVAQERHVLSNFVGNMLVLLRRGREYGIRLELESMIQGTVGSGDSRANATWKSLTVRVDEDEGGELAQQLADHDQAMRLQLAEHDSVVRDELAAHDADIKGLLTGIKDGQQEIIRLLLTPQGQRESAGSSFPIKKK